MNKAPTSVIVLGIIGIIWSFNVVFGISLNVYVQFLRSGPPNPVRSALHSDPVYNVFMWIATPIGLGLGILLFVASIGSLKLKQWGRKSMLIYAWMALIQGVVVDAMFNLVYLIPKMKALLPATTGPAPGGIMHGPSGACCGALLGLIYPAFVMYYFTRRNVIDAFNGIFPVPRSNFPVIFPGDQTRPPSV